MPGGYRGFGRIPIDVRAPTGYAPVPDVGAAEMDNGAVLAGRLERAVVKWTTAPRYRSTKTARHQMRVARLVSSVESSSTCSGSPSM